MAGSQEKGSDTAAPLCLWRLRRCQPVSKRCPRRLGAQGTQSSDISQSTCADTSADRWKPNGAGCMTDSDRKPGRSAMSLHDELARRDRRFSPWPSDAQTVEPKVGAGAEVVD